MIICEKCSLSDCTCDYDEYERLKRKLKIKSSLDNKISWCELIRLQDSIYDIQRRIPGYCVRNADKINEELMRISLYNLLKTTEELYNKITFE